MITIVADLLAVLWFGRVWLFVYVFIYFLIIMYFLINSVMYIFIDFIIYSPIFDVMIFYFIFIHPLSAL